MPPRRREGRRGRLLLTAVAVAVALAAALGLKSSAFAAGASFTVTSTADAVDANVGNGVCRTATGACTLRAAIQEANAIPGEDTIQVPAGTYAIAIAPQNTNLAESGDFDITGPVTIVGGGPGSTILDGGVPTSSAPEIRGRDRVIEIHASAGYVALTGLSIQEGYSSEQGGGIYTRSSGLLRLENVHVRDSYATKYGGGIGNVGTGRVELIGSSMSGNGAKEGGSAINNHVAGSLAITAGSAIVDNPGASIGAYPITGAAINNEGDGDAIGTIEIADSTVARNESSSSGGGIRNDRDGEIVVERSTITDNRTGSSGAGIYSTSGAVLVRDGSSISGNHAGNLISSGDGGGIYMAGGATKAGAPARVQVVDSTISGNTAQGDGAGIFSGLDAELTLTDSSITGNAAKDEGGGFSVQARADVAVTRMTFEGNSAGVAGGGAHMYAEGFASFIDTTFTENTAGEAGGGLSTDGSGTVSVVRSEFRGNSSLGDGGAMWISTSGLQVISDSTVAGNSSAEGGGGIFNSGMIVTLERLEITDNTALLDGGGIKSEGGGLLTVLDSTFTRNTGENGGAFANEADGTMQVSGTAFVDNVARLDGGGYYEVSDAAAAIVNSTISRNGAGDRGGGVYTNADATLHITNVTITDNSAASGSGLSTSVESLNFPVRPATAVILQNTIVAGNHDGINCHGAVFSDGGNLDDGTTCFFDDPSDITRTAPALEPLADNGGPTATHALDPSSYAVDLGVSPCPDVDQRGVDRPQNAGCDMGAFEFEGTPTPPAEPPLGPPTGPDRDPPVVKIDAKPALRTTDTFAEFRFRANEISRYECVLDPPAATFSGCESPHDYTPLALGLHTFEVRAIDAAGNAGASVAYTWRIVEELDPPETTIDSGPAALTKQASATLAFSADEPASFECSLDGVALPDCSSPRTLTGLPDGGHTFAVRAIDRSFNPDESPAVHTWTVDTTPPETAIASGPTGPTNDATPTFNFTSSEAGATFACALSPEALAPCSTPLTLPLHADGEYTLLVASTDAAGNADPSAAARSFRVDTVAPETSLSSAPPALTNSASASFAFSSTETGSTFACALDGEAPAPCTSAALYTDLADGQHSFSVVASDAAGNADTSAATHAWTIDTTPPQTAIAAAPASLTQATSATFEVTSTETGSTFACSLDGAPAGACLSEVSYAGLADGEHRFSVVARDAAGNADPSAASYTWTVDTTPPDTTIVSRPAALTNVSSAEFVFESNESGSSFACSLDHGEYAPCTSAAPYTELADGAHSFAVRARDAAGNTDPNAASFAWTIDTVAPEASIVSGPSGLTNESSAGFSFISTEAGSSFACALDEALAAPCTSPASYTGLADGEHSFAVTATDAAGNANLSPASRTWTIDTVAPETTIDTAPTDPGNDATPTFTFSASEDASFRCSFDEEPLAACASPVTSEALADGGHTFFVEATDAAGNVEPEPAGFSFTVDVTAPETSIESGPDDPGNDATPTFTFSASEDASLRCSVDEEPSAACTSPFTSETLAEGAHSFSVEATDPAGNVETVPASVSFTVDLTAPDTSITAGPSGLTNASAASFSFTSTETGSSFVCALDGGAPAPCTSAAHYTDLADGEHSFSVRATDAAGNEDASAASRTWTIDTFAPETSIDTGPASPGNDSTPTFAFSATEAASFRCALDAGPLAACTSPFTSSELGEGGHSFSVQATDAAGNVEADAASRPFVVDLTPPQTTITDGPSGLTNASAASFSFTSTETGSSFACSLDGTASSCTSPASYTALADGSHSFSVRATDAAGNADTNAATRTWTIDTVAPATSITDSPPALTNQSGVSFSFASTETGSSFACSLDAAPFSACTSPQPYAGLGDAAHTFGVRATDAAGNADASVATLTWRIDTTPPLTSITSGPPATTTETNASFELGASEPGATFACSLDEGPFAACTSPHQVTGLGLGPHELEVRATDAAGNTDPTPASHSWTVRASDTTPPETTITAGPSGATNDTTPTFEFSASEPSSFQCRVDTASFAACDSPYSAATPTEGTHTFEVRATDAAGLTDTTPASRAFTVDTVAPQTTITSGPPATTTSTSAQFEFASSETGSSFACSLDGAGFSPCSSPVSYTVGAGSHAFEVQAKDAAGNTDATSANRAWTVTAPDTTPPETTITAGPSGATNDTTPTFEFSASEAATFQCRVDAAAFASCSSPHTTAALGQGAHTFEVRAIDSAGNADATPASRSISVDTVAPQTTITSGPPATTTSTSARFEFTSNEAGSSFECSLDGAAFASCSSPTTYTVGGGSHQFRVQARDAAGNLDATPATSSWTVQAGDTTPPETTITGGPTGPTNDSTPTYAFSSESGATFQCRVDTIAFTSCSSPHTTPALTQGAHTFAVRATDAAGNVDASPASRSITVDTIAPQTTITAGPSGPTNDSTPTFEFSASEAATFQCRVDSAAFAGCSSPHTTAALGAGAHTFQVRAVDSAGSVDASPASRAITVDTTAPNTTITQAPPATTSNATVSFQFTSSETGSAFECSLDGSGFAPCAPPVTHTVSPGTHQFQVRARDGAGNTDASPAAASWTYQVADTTPPETTITNGPPATTTSATVSFEFTSSEAGSSFECSLDGSGFGPCSSPVSYTVSPGTHQFQVRARDAAGNTDTSAASRSWTYEPPAGCTSGGIVTRGASADGWLLESSPSSSYGTDSVLKVDAKSGANARAVVRFALPAIPSGCQVVDARLRLYAGSYKTGRTIDAYAITANWFESTLTWGNQPAPVGSAASAPSGSGYVQWNVTAQLASTYATNTGFLVRDRTEGGGGVEQGYHSREKGADNPPQLVVTFG